MKTLIIPFLVIIISLESGFSQVDIAENVFEKVREAYNTVSYMGELTITQAIGERNLTFHKKVWAHPPEGYSEQFIDFPSERFRRFNRRDYNLPRLRRQRILEAMEKNMEKQARPLNFPIPFIQLLKDNYKISVDDGESVAGRATRLISLEPLYSLRPLRKIWIDREKNIVLKREIFNEKKRLIFREVFKRLKIDPEFPEEIFKEKHTQEKKRKKIRVGKPIVTCEYASFEGFKKGVKIPTGIPKCLPEGFKLNIVKTIQRRNLMTIHSNYTDGVLSFSLFQTRGRVPGELNERILKDTKDNLRVARRLSRPIFPRRIGEYNFIITGNCSSELLKSVLGSVVME